MQGGRVLKHWQSSGSNIAGLGEGDMEVMRLREENEALMESLVRTKVELAETEGMHTQLNLVQDPLLFMQALNVTTTTIIV